MPIPSLIHNTAYEQEHRQLTEKLIKIKETASAVLFHNPANIFTVSELKEVLKQIHSISKP